MRKQLGSGLSSLPWPTAFSAMKRSGVLCIAALNVMLRCDSLEKENNTIALLISAVLPRTRLWQHHASSVTARPCVHDRRKYDQGGVSALAATDMEVDMSQVGMAGTAFAAMASRLGLRTPPPSLDAWRGCPYVACQAVHFGRPQMPIAAGIKTAVSQQVLTAAYDGSFLATPIQFNSPVTDKVPLLDQAPISLSGPDMLIHQLVSAEVWYHSCTCRLRSSWRAFTACTSHSSSWMRGSSSAPTRRRAASSSCCSSRPQQTVGMSLPSRYAPRITYVAEHMRCSHTYNER